MEHILILVFHFVLSKAAVRCEISSFPFPLFLPVHLVLLRVNCTLAALAAGAGSGVADPQALHPQGVSACSLRERPTETGHNTCLFYTRKHIDTHTHALNLDAAQGCKVCNFTSFALLTLLPFCVTAVRELFFLPAVAIVTWDTECRGSFMMRTLQRSICCRTGTSTFQARLISCSEIDVPFALFWLFCPRCSSLSEIVAVIVWLST